MIDIFKYDLRKQLIGTRIKQERKGLKLSQTELADKVSSAVELGDDKCISQSTIASWENGTTLPPLGRLIALSEILDCDISYLLGDYPQRRRDTVDICAATGLSAPVVESLVSRNCATGYDDGAFNPNKAVIGVLDLLLSNGYFFPILMANIYDYYDKYAAYHDKVIECQRARKKYDSVDNLLQDFEAGRLLPTDSLKNLKDSMDSAAYRIARDFSTIVDGIVAQQYEKNKATTP